MKRFILTACCVITASLLVAQTRQGSLATLIQKGDRKAALEKIRAGADVNVAQPDGTRPIHWAVYRIDYELLDALIAKKAKVDVANEFGSTPLFTRDELASAGVGLILYPLSAFRAMNAAALKVYDAVRRDGTQKNVVDLMQTRADLYKYLDYHAYEQKLDALFVKEKSK